MIEPVWVEQLVLNKASSAAACHELQGDCLVRLQTSRIESKGLAAMQSQAETTCMGQTGLSSLGLQSSKLVSMLLEVKDGELDS